MFARKGPKQYTHYPRIGFQCKCIAIVDVSLVKPIAIDKVRSTATQASHVLAMADTQNLVPRLKQLVALPPQAEILLLNKLLEWERSKSEMALEWERSKSEMVRVTAQLEAERRESLRSQGLLNMRGLLEWFLKRLKMSMNKPNETAGNLCKDARQDSVFSGVVSSICCVAGWQILEFSTKWCALYRKLSDIHDAPTPEFYQTQQLDVIIHTDRCSHDEVLALRALCDYYKFPFRV